MHIRPIALNINVVLTPAERKTDKVTYEEIKGLSSEEVLSSRQKYGDNSMPRQKTQTFIQRFFSNFGDPIIKILLAALCINIIFMLKNFDIFEAIGIFVAIITATLVSTISEYGSEMAFEKLRNESENVKCRVTRNGEMIYVKESELVVGDLVLISAGDKIPADGKIISGALCVDMSALNGESREVRKFPLGSGTYGNKTDAQNILMRGSVVTQGEGKMVVLSVGESTAYGKLAGELQEKTRTSPLKLKLSKLAVQISRIGYVASAVVSIGYLFNIICIDSGFDTELMTLKITDASFMLNAVIHAITLAITIVVVAVPEGLPMMITVVLSSNMKRMLNDNIMVRKLVGIETAGSMNILFCDKTGTLTTGEQSVESIVSGSGAIYGAEKKISDCAELYRCLVLNAFFNCESIYSRGKVIGGNATDRALTKYFCKGKITCDAKLINKIPFDSTKKYSAAIIEEDGKKRVFIKGAPEILLAGVRRIYTDDGRISASFDKEMILRRLKCMTESAERVIAVVESSTLPSKISEGDLTFVCLIGIRDKIRKDAASSVEKLRGAGVQVVMLTGDNKETARAVALECSIITKYSDAIVLTSDELARMSDEELSKRLPDIAVVARALPSDKTRLVRVAQSRDMVAGMTGDGVNDAPALKIADVGFAMGSGTEVAKEAGDIVMLDNNLSYIVKTVVYGRTIFKSIRKFIMFQLTMNMCAVGVSLIGPFIGIDTPVTVIQMLWVNIIMDTLGGLAFAGEAPSEEFLKEKPKKRKENLVNRYMSTQIFFGALTTMLICIFFLRSEYVRNFFGFAKDPIYFMSGFFCLFIFLGIANCFMSRSQRINILANLSKNKPFIFIMLAVGIIQLAMIYFGNSVFRTKPLNIVHLLFVFALVTLSVLIELVRRIITRVIGKGRGDL